MTSTATAATPLEFDFRPDGELKVTRTATGRISYLIYPKTPSVLYVVMLFTEPSARGKRNGSRLFDALLAAADRAGLRVEVTAGPISPDNAAKWGVLNGGQLLGMAQRRGFKPKSAEDPFFLERPHNLRPERQPATNAIQYSSEVKTARLDAVTKRIGAGAALQLRSGPPPTNCEARDQGEVLATIKLPSPWMSETNDGIKSKVGQWFASAEGSGAAGHFRIYDATGTCHLQGTVVAKGQRGSLLLDNVNIVEGEMVTITAFSIAAKGD